MEAWGKEESMSLRNWTFGLAVLPLGCVLAAALVLPAPAAADEYADAAAAYGTTEFMEEVWMPAATHARPAAAVKVAVAEPGRGAEEFLAEVFSPATGNRGVEAEVGAASGEPEEAVVVAPSAAIPESERAAREKWLESIWNSP
jgi:hypothetical protein